MSPMGCPSQSGRENLPSSLVTVSVLCASPRFRPVRMSFSSKCVTKDLVFLKQTWVSIVEEAETGKGWGDSNEGKGPCYKALRSAFDL